MPRRKPASAKQKKAAMQEKRAVKRGDISASEITTKPSQKARRGPTGRTIGKADGSSSHVDAIRKLQSDFVKVSAEFLEQTKILASNEPLPRPLSPQSSCFPPDLILPANVAGPSPQQLSCPKRPKWRFDMTKKEVEKNEEGVHKKWLLQMDTLMERWCTDTKKDDTKDHDTDGPDDLKQEIAVVPRAPSHFERNLEVWRQLWRVSEISEVLLVLLDCRCPPLHFPPTLEAYLADKRIILVLTKVDIAGAEHTDAWIEYLRARHPGRPIVQVESYVEKLAGAYTQGGGRHTFEPHIPMQFRAQLVQALRQIHEEMQLPPAHIRSDEAKASRWRPPNFKRSVDWDAVLDAHGGQVGHSVGGAVAPNSVGAQDETAEPEYFTVGLIGQPNVGKSSLLNALFGTSKVRASRTPGKTKHFQTLFWTPEVRLVDCPGLVVPNLVPMEMQVMCGILPISRVSAIAASIHYAAKFMPLERILDLTHPSASEKQVEDKRTWREGAPRPITQPAEPTWTAMDILTAYANKKGWVTAKAGRPDVNRAGNFILRVLAEGKVKWAFWPPDHPVTFSEAADRGIWLVGDSGDIHDDDDVSEDGDAAHEEAKANTDTESDADSAGDESAISGNGEGEDEDKSDSDSETTGKTLPVSAKVVSRFSALGVEGGEDDEEQEEDSADDSDGM